MVEEPSFCSGEVIQPRMQWNAVLKLAKNISAEAGRAKIDPHEVIFVGGFAAYLHAKDAIGERATGLWRGTHDVDIVVTKRGGTGMILAGLQNSGEYQYIDSAPSHFLNKQTWKIQDKPQGFLSGNDRRTDVDIYFLDQDKNTVNFNERRITLKNYASTLASFRWGV